MAWESAHPSAGFVTGKVAKCPVMSTHRDSPQGAPGRGTGTGPPGPGPGLSTAAELCPQTPREAQWGSHGPAGGQTACLHPTPHLLAHSARHMGTAQGRRHTRHTLRRVGDGGSRWRSRPGPRGLWDWRGCGRPGGIPGPTGSTGSRHPPLEAPQRKCILPPSPPPPGLCSGQRSPKAHASSSARPTAVSQAPAIPRPAFGS